MVVTSRLSQHDLDRPIRQLNCSRAAAHRTSEFIEPTGIMVLSNVIEYLRRMQ